MTRFSTLVLRVLGTLVAAGLLLVGMPMSPASAAPTDHVTIAANSSPVAEGNSGTTPVTFTISYTGNPTAFSVDWTTANGTATAGSDYTAASGTVSFNGLPSDRTKIVTVQVKGDTSYEGDETFSVNVSNAQPPANIVFDTSSATQTITDDETPPSLSLDDVTMSEGDLGSTTFTFTVSLSPASGTSASVNYATANGTATTADSDYASASGTLNFLSGDTTKTVDVTVNGDTTNESDETFFVDLSGAVNATIADTQGVGTITNDDSVPTISVDDQIVGEGDAGTTTMTFNVTLSNPSGQTVTVDYTTNDGTATTGDNDYDAASGTVTFDPGDTTKPVDVTVNGDTKREPDQDFTLDLSNASNATIADDQGTGTITNDDPIPDASIGDASIAEGDAGTATLSFDVTLSHATDDTVTVDWTTGDGTATTGDSDYVAASGTVTFLPGDTTEPVDVTVNGDTTYEADEDLSVTLSNPTNAGLADDTATGTITNDDAVPAIAIDDQVTDEGNTGDNPVLEFNVTLSNPSDQQISVDYTTNDDTATTADSDYAAASGTLTFDPGDTTKPVDVTVNGDDTYEADETFTVDLSNESGATLGDDQGVGTITNDDAVPAIAIDDQVTDEGNTGDNPVLEFNVTLSNPSDQQISVDYTTNDDTATTADSDYAAASGTLTFDPGDTTKPVDVTVNGDDVPEPDETFTVDLSNESGATLGDDQGTGTITNDDATPAVSIEDASVTEGDSGDTTLSFDVTLSQISAGTATVDYATADDTATTADGDYDAATGTVTFDPGQDTKQVDVTVHGDVTYEDDETLTVVLSNPGAATIDVDTATGTITNDDAPPTLSIDNVSKNEGNSGTTSFTFTVTKTGATALPATVDWTTGGGTATPGSDYVSGSGTLNFPKNTTTRQITVLVNGDIAVEANQTFDVTLSNETGATISDDTGAGTIKNDDKYATTLTLKRRIATGTVVAKGILEPATAGNEVRVALLRRKNGTWVRVAAKTVSVTKIKDRDGDGKPDGRYRASFARPNASGSYKLRVRFAGSSTQKPARRQLRFRL